MLKTKCSERFLKYRFFAFAVVFLCFFPPMSVNVLSDRFGGVWKLLHYGIKAGQILLATAGYVLWIMDRKRQKSFWFIGLVAHICVMAAAGLLNGNTRLITLGGLYANAGFCLLFSVLYIHAKEDFLRAGLITFFALSVWGVITVYLFPMGFLQSETVYEAIYGLGSKNNAFPFYFAYIFFWLLAVKDTDKRTCILIQMAIIATVIAGYICKSTNTMICMVLIMLLTLSFFFLKRFFAKLNPVIFLAAFVALIALVYVGIESDLVASFLSKFKRSLTFSGRDVLWDQAVAYFSDSPLIGSGGEIIYTLASKVTTPHAHSQWLDKLAKYGIVPMLLLGFVVLRTFLMARKTADRTKANLLCGMLLIYMLHMSFDTYNYNFFTIVIIVANNMFDEDTTQPLVPEKNIFTKFLCRKQVK